MKAEEHLYYLDRSDRENSRLDEQSAGIFELLGNRFTLAPVENAAKIADIGCGTGIVSQYLAHQYPDAKVIGVDLFPDPGLYAAKGNLAYVQGDIKDMIGKHPELGEESLDYIFCRLLVFAFRGWQERMKEFVQVMKHGAYLECQEMCTRYCKDGAVDPSITPKWMTALNHAAQKVGLDPDVAFNASRYMEEAGLEIVSKVEYKWPIGNWLAEERPETRRIGELITGREQFQIKIAFDKMMPGLYTAEQIEEFKREVDTLKLTIPGVYVPYVVTIARKPFKYE